MGEQKKPKPSLEYDRKLRKNVTEDSEVEAFAEIVPVMSRSVQLKQFLHSNISVEKLGQVVVDGLNATDTHSTRDGEYESPNWGARYKFFNLAAQLTKSLEGADNEFSKGGLQGIGHSGNLKLLQQNISIYTGRDTPAKGDSPKAK